ncbi:heavy-metal-associated domain-containing protein [Desulfobulbus alkaliphilus]|uniref:heavy-metal-associated domain-containing protein n=1 Tax=Desulfobulbus alkaliphilus TaxID=869814 RepID=UPI00196301C5|nr:heavy metal-associated domain-containing protein [Desulfobulbus alkaliphilus]MBM9538705.1 heavy-metal-associated domain-containing protein [Desulfobulbus alkaliphilus]
MMPNPTREELIDALLDHMLYLRIAHHVEGRIRIKASWNGAKKLNQTREGDIETIIAAIPGIKDYRINKQALSVVITYDPRVFPHVLWEEVAALGQYPARRQAVRERLLEALAGWTPIFKAGSDSGAEVADQHRTRPKESPVQ